ncbi:uncharacterized protein B0T23DRAFT_397241 [Neurospora hispaniola]|uniref:Uncharacterized protein n=1 Tax=Neurospora hispaniola TaxID=588809 RepID=A0AAJ0I6Q4_9PEZI|nr:hypothetical protein B0T23DRAFT_397241 [Neurospora hispaniola]
MDPSKKDKAKAEPDPEPEPDMEPPLVSTLTKITDPNNVFYTDENGVKYRVCLPRSGEHLKTAEANFMSYTDDKGVYKEIYLPQGTVKTAWDHLENERWDELAKFEPYTGQGYTEDDFKAFEERLKRRREGQEN